MPTLKERTHSRILESKEVALIKEFFPKADSKREDSFKNPESKEEL